MAATGSSALKRIGHLKGEYGGDAAARKSDLLRALGAVSLSRPGEVLAFHEVLCFLRAYPDNREILGQVEGMLRSFRHRRDLKRFRRQLADTGIAGTEIRFPFFYFTAEWLAGRWPESIFVDWNSFGKQSDLVDMLPLLVPYPEMAALESLVLSAREWIKRLKGPDETDAYFLIRRFRAFSRDAFSREAAYERLDIPIRLKAGEGTPSRTEACYGVRRIAFQTRAFPRVRESLRSQIRASRVRVRSVSAREGRKLIDLAREAMITRSRDLDAFEHAHPGDVRLVDCGGGLQFACIGVIPERRLLLDAVYGFLTLKNGVPIGYFLTGTLFHSAEVAFNMFDSFRGAESGWIYGRALAMVRRLFGSDTFVVPPYQMGHNNPEALQSGAWWFYYKKGFRSRDPEVRRIIRGELRKMAGNPRHRTDIKTLNRLSSENMYLHLGPRRGVNIGTIDTGNIGLRIMRFLAGRFGADRERGLRTCSREVAGLLGLRSSRGFTPGEKLAWQRWSPLVLALDGIEDWSQAEKRKLVEIIRAKGGERESRFVELFDRHGRLQKAIADLSKDEES